MSWRSRKPGLLMLLLKPSQFQDIILLIKAEVRPEEVELAFLFKITLSSIKLTYYLTSSSSSYESMFINITCSRGADMLIGVIYRPPGTKLEIFNAEIETLLTTLNTKKYANKKAFLTGDFNIDILASQTHLPTGAFIDCMLMHHFLPLILQPTRITDSSATLIDNIFTNSHDGIYINDLPNSSTLLHYILFLKLCTLCHL